MKRLRYLFLFISIQCLSFVTYGYAFVQEDENVVLPHYFSDGAVLQRNSDVKITGRTEKGNVNVRILCSWSDYPVNGKSDVDGNFSISVRTPDAGGPYTVSVNNKVIEDIMIGEVWLASGQSNMVWTLANSDMEGLAGENNPNIRVFTVPIRLSGMPLTDLEGGKWSYGPLEEIKSTTTAVGYYFARQLQSELDIPVGVICSAKGGTGAEEWMSGDNFLNLPLDVQKTFPATGKRWGGCRFNAMISPIKDYVFKGVIWYQGENNVNRWQTYSIVMESLINEWRCLFANKEMPFYLVQLPSFEKPGWKELRAMQQIVADNIYNCEFVSAIDQGEENNVHPASKIQVGKRLGELALSNVYGMDMHRKSSPRVSDFKQNGNSIIVSFCNVSALASIDGEDIRYFEVCGKDGVYHSATAVIEGNDKIRVSSPDVKKPIKIRYYWVDYGKPNLIDKDGWPVAPFIVR